MLKPQFKVKTEKQTSDYGKFVLEPLEQGYGDTLGVALRRVLLSSLKGAAITELRIEGVQHQFSNLEGLKEDIIELILNIKQLRIKYKEEKEIMLKLSAKGPGKVKAADIKTPANVEIINGDLELANLADKKAKLDIEMKLGTGFGFSSAEERKADDIQIIPIDAVFSPIRRFNYKVETTRVGRKTDFNKLILEIWTDGTIEPKQALEEGAENLVDYFKQIYEPVFKKVEKKIKPPKNQGFLSLTVEELDLPTRIINALVKGGYKTVKDLTEVKKAKIVSVKNLGGKSILIVEDKLKEKGVGFKE